MELEARWQRAQRPRRKSLEDTPRSPKVAFKAEQGQKLEDLQGLLNREDPTDFSEE